MKVRAFYLLAFALAPTKNLYSTSWVEGRIERNARELRKVRAERDSYCEEVALQLEALANFDNLSTDLVFELQVHHLGCKAARKECEQFDAKTVAHHCKFDCFPITLSWDYCDGKCKQHECEHKHYDESYDFS